MKLIPPAAVLIILIIYWLLTIASWRAIASWLEERLPSRRRVILRINFLYAGLMTMLFLYIYGVRPPQTAPYYYFFHTSYNALLIADIFSKLPLAVASLITLFRLPKRRKKVIIRMGLIVSTGLFALFITGILFGTQSLTVKEQTLLFRDLPKAFDGFRILHFSDTHLGSFRNSKLPDRFSVKAGKFYPDLVCFTGDLINNFGTETVNYTSELRQLTSASGNFAVLGNHDYGDYTAWPDSLSKAINLEQTKNCLREAGFRLLCNTHERLVKDSDTLYIIGFGNPGHRPLTNYADRELAVRNLPESCFCIVLCHDPAFWTSDLCGDERFRLTLSGHTHGLQWGIYPAGIPLSMARLIRERWAGLYKNGEKFLYVNRGLGVVGMYFRIDMPAEITLVTLKRAD